MQEHRGLTLFPAAKSARRNFLNSVVELIEFTTHHFHRSLACPVTYSKIVKSFVLRYRGPHVSNFPFSQNDRQQCLFPSRIFYIRETAAKQLKEYPLIFGLSNPIELILTVSTF